MLENENQEGIALPREYILKKKKEKKRKEKRRKKKRRKIEIISIFIHCCLTGEKKEESSIEISEAREIHR